MKKFKDHCWKRAKMKRIIDIPDEPTMRLLLLNENIIDVSLEGLPESLKAYAKEMHATPMPHTVTIGYDHLVVEDVLKKILPPGVEIPSSFEQAGHIAHLNLREESLPYKYIIGQVILDKNPGIRTVVNKLSSIASEFRTFPMELLAGVEDYVVTLKESNANFTFNFCDVYWNSRLQTEHQRMVDFIGLENKKHNDLHVVADMMAGVGPFAVPLAMEGTTVYANDLNPESYKYLVMNSQKNKCGAKLKSYNLDGRAFIMQMQQDRVHIDHILMNLPQNATDFLDVFIGYTKRGECHVTEAGKGIVTDTQHRLPTIHVYAFSSEEDPILDVANRAATSLQCKVENLGKRVVSTTELGILGISGPKENAKLSHAVYEDNFVVGHRVRDVAPKKIMICLSFVLPSVVASAHPVITVDHTDNKDDEQSNIKKRKL